MSERTCDHCGAAEPEDDGTDTARYFHTCPVCREETCPECSMGARTAHFDCEG